MKRIISAPSFASISKNKEERVILFALLVSGWVLLGIFRVEPRYV